MSGMKAWTAKDVEAETLAAYHVPTMHTRMADWQIERLNAWNRAVALGGEHYQRWRDAYIAPIEEGWRNGRQNMPVRLARHRIARSIEYEERSRQDTLKWVAQLTPEDRVKFGFDDPTRFPISDTPASAQSPPSETAPRSR
jgi:hypothetical protein